MNIDELIMDPGMKETASLSSHPTPIQAAPIPEPHPILRLSQLRMSESEIQIPSHNPSENVKRELEMYHEQNRRTTLQDVIDQCQSQASQAVIADPEFSCINSRGSESTKCPSLKNPPKASCVVIPVPPLTQTLADPDDPPTSFAEIVQHCTAEPSKSMANEIAKYRIKKPHDDLEKEIEKEDQLLMLQSRLHDAHEMARRHATGTYSCK